MSVFYSEDRAFFGLGVTPVVDSCRGNGTMTKHFLNFLDVCLVIEGIGGGGRAERMRPDAEVAMCRDDILIKRRRIERPIQAGHRLRLGSWVGRKSGPVVCPASSRYSSMKRWVFGLDGHIANFRALSRGF